MDVYLDYNASAPIRPEAREATCRALDLPGNPSSVHGFGRAARRAVEDAREAVAALVGARSRHIIFTSGGTEANAMALAGTGRRNLIVSAGEHDSVLNAAPEAARVPLGSDGVTDLQHLSEALARARAPSLVSVMLANNETGVIQPVAEVADRARAQGALVHCDAVQAAGKIKIDFAGLDVDLMSLSAHKIGGPKGVGALVVAEGIELVPLLRGGGQELRRRAGTENVAGIAGFGAAALAAARDISRAEPDRIAALRDEMERQMRAIAPDLIVLGAGAPRVPNTSCVAVPGLLAETLVMALDLAGVAVGAGAACSSGKVTPSHVLHAMGCGDDLAAAAIRVSLGWASQPDDVKRFIAAWSTIYKSWKARSARRAPSAA